jgi:hypothetical protein
MGTTLDICAHKRNLSLSRSFANVLLSSSLSCRFVLYMEHTHTLARSPLTLTQQLLRFYSEMKCSPSTHTRENRKEKNYQFCVCLLRLFLFAARLFPSCLIKCLFSTPYMSDVRDVEMNLCVSFLFSREESSSSSSSSWRAASWRGRLEEKCGKHSSAAAASF